MGVIIFESPCGCRAEDIDHEVHLTPCSRAHDADMEAVARQIAEEEGVPLEITWDA